MNEELIRILERIATALEKISEHLSKEEIQNAQKEINSQHIVKDEKENESNFLKERQNIIIEFLNNRNIKIRRIPPEDEADSTLDSISIFMGNRYNLIKPFYDQIRQKMNSGDSIKIDLRNKPQEEISSICQLGTRLYEIAFLEEYSYKKSPRYFLFAVPSRTSKALNFFSGKWLERFVKSQVISVIQKVTPGVRFSYISNLQIKLPNGDEFEFDLFLEIEEEIFWFEAKSGEYQKYMEKYSKISQILKLDKDHSFMILTDITETGAEALSGLYGINVVGIENFSEKFSNCISKYQNWNQLEDLFNNETIA
ncbi:MAG: hypothetical protein ACUVWN_15820 [bacterium]